MARDDLIVFVTELARRQHVRRAVLQQGFVDASRYLTLSRLREMCVLAAREHGLLNGRALSEVRARVIARRIAEDVRAEFGAAGPLGVLSARALADALENLVEILSPFGDDAEEVHRLMLAPADPRNKLCQLGTLYQAYRRRIASEGLVDTRDANAAILALLEGDRRRWPPLLSGLEGNILFRSIRWLNAFEEKLVIALKKRMGKDRVKVFSALPSAHAEKVEDRLKARVRSEVMMGAEEAWTAWAENLTDAMEVEDPNVAIASRDRLSFSRSVGVYGEIEDLARRVRYEINERKVSPERIALVVRNLSDCADAIENVFRRFGIPCYLRRGMPVPSVPLAKTCLSLLSFPIAFERDRFCALLQSPALTWPGFRDADQRREVANDLRAAGVRPRLAASNIRQRLQTYYTDQRPDLSPEEMQSRIKAASTALSALRSIGGPATLAAHAANARELIRRFGLENPQADGVPVPARFANLRALQAITATIDELADAAAGGDQPRPLREFFDLLEECIENNTVASGRSDERGVWVLNPFDTAGLRFDVVLIAGLNEGAFPAIARQDSLFNDAERESVREGVRMRGITLPEWGLPLSALRMLQESILFLISIGSAQRRLVLSYRASDADGRDLVPGDFFRSLWNLAGWPSVKPAAGGGAPTDIEADDYDAWRMDRLGANSFLARHLDRQRTTPPYQRTPMPGESYLATIPLALCAAADEARQRIAQGVEDAAVRGECEAFRAKHARAAIDAGPRPAAVAKSIHDGIVIERAREAFFNAPAAERPPQEPYCGKLASAFGFDFAGKWLARHDEFSPTGLETLARCRYRFLLSRLCRLQSLRTQEDTPDIMDRGSIIHRILDLAYRALTGRTAELDALDPELARRHGALFRPAAWAVRPAPGVWQLAEDAKGQEDALPLAGFRQATADRYVDMIGAVADAVFRNAEAAGEVIRLGDPGIWNTEKPKIRQIVENYIRLDADSAGGEGRFPALFELRFGRQPDREPPHMPPLELAGDEGIILVHGQIDRIDLLFDERGALSRILVIDYKGPSRGGLSEQAYAEEILENLDCQLPAYGFAAQQFLFGRHDADDLNAMTDVVYHIQARAPDEMNRQFAKRRVNLGFAAEDATPLTSGFAAALRTNVNLLRQADFSVDPLDCTYCDFAHICRVDVNALKAARED